MSDDLKDPDECRKEAFAAVEKFMAAAHLKANKAKKPAMYLYYFFAEVAKAHKSIAIDQFVMEEIAYYYMDGMFSALHCHEDKEMSSQSKKVIFQYMLEDVIHLGLKYRIPIDSNQQTFLSDGYDFFRERAASGEISTEDNKRMLEDRAEHLRGNDRICDYKPYMRL